MDEKFSITKLLSGFAFWKGEVFGKILYYVAIVSVCLGVFYVLFIKQTNKTTQKAETITNTTINQEKTALELQLIPPRIQIGALKFKLF